MGTTAEDVLIRFVAEDKVTPQLGQMRSAFNQTGIQGVSSIGNVNTAVGGLESSLGNLSNTLQTAGAVMGAVFGVYGLSQIYQQTVGVAALKEGYTYLMGGMMQSKQAAGELMEATKEFSYSTPFMFRDYAYGLTLIRSTSSATKEEMEAMLPGMTNIALLYQLKGMDPKMGMLAYSQGLIGNFRSMRMQAGITADKLKEFGWSGQEGDIKSYTTAMDRYFEHMGLNASKMNTYEVSLAKFMSTFRAAMAGLGEILLPPLEKLLKFGTDVMQSIPKPAKIAGVAIVGLLFAILAIMPWLPLMASGFWMIAGALGFTSPAAAAAAATQEMYNVALTHYTLAVLAAIGPAGLLNVNHAAMTPVNLSAAASTGILSGAMQTLSAVTWEAVMPLIPLIAALIAIGVVVGGVIYYISKFKSAEQEATDTMGKMTKEVDKQKKKKQELEGEIAELEKKQKDGNISTDESRRLTKELNDKRDTLTQTTNYLTQAEKDLKEAQGLETELEDRYGEIDTYTTGLEENRKGQIKDALIKKGYTKEEAEKYVSHLGTYQEKIEEGNANADTFQNRQMGRMAAWKTYMEGPGFKYVTDENIKEYEDVMVALEAADKAMHDPRLTEDERKKAAGEYLELSRQKKALDNVRWLKTEWAGFVYWWNGGSKQITDAWNDIKEGIGWVIDQLGFAYDPGKKLTDVLKGASDWWSSFVGNLHKGIGSIPGLQELANTLAFIQGTTPPNLSSSGQSGSGSSVGDILNNINNKVQGINSDQVKEKVNEQGGGVLPKIIKGGSPLGVYDSSGIGPPMLRFPQLTPGFLKGLEDQTSYQAGQTRGGGVGDYNVHHYNVKVDARHMSEEQLMGMFIQISERYSRPKKIPVAR